MIREFGENTWPEKLNGHFLISEANMSDPNFYRTVVLIIEHNVEGAFGLVVNRKSNLSLSEVLNGFDTKRGQQTPLYVGGPVQQDFLFVMHSDLPDEPISDTVITPVPGIHFEPAFRLLEKYFREDYWNNLSEKVRPDIHLFLGYSGWAPGQLEREMDNGSWMIIEARPHIVFHPHPEEGWEDALREKGGIYKVFVDRGQDPSLN